MRNVCKTVDYDALRKRALDAVLLNVMDAPRAAPRECSAGLQDKQAEVRRALNEDVSQRIGNAVRAVVSAWRRPRRPFADSRDRIIDAAQL